MLIILLILWVHYELKLVKFTILNYHFWNDDTSGQYFCDKTQLIIMLSNYLQPIKFYDYWRTIILYV